MRFIVDLTADRAYLSDSEEEPEFTAGADLLVVEVEPEGPVHDLFLCHFPRVGARVFTDSEDVAAWLLAYGVGIVRPIKVEQECEHRSRLVC